LRRCDEMGDRVAISILTFRRRDHLARSLNSVYRHRREFDEILVIDNAAEKTLKEWLEKSFPGVRYVPMPYNGGCDGRNAALREMRAPMLITLDDDVELVSGDCVATVRDAFERHSDLACLNFKVLDREGHVLGREWCHPRPLSDASHEFETCFILEGACALRREAVLEAGGYPANFFLGHEGLDLAYRLINRGKRILYSPKIQVKHYAAPEERPGWRPYYYNTRNGIWIAYRFFSWPSAIGDALENTAKMAFFAFRAGHPLAHLEGFLAGLWGMPNVGREPLTAGALARLKVIRSRRVPLLGRIRRHLNERIQ
jgi:GT2 family glycosyltransferase